MVTFALLALSLFSPVLTTDAPTLFPSIVAVGGAERAVAPPPREKVCPHRGDADCLCADGDLRCRARAALSLAAACKTVPVVMPSKKRIAAQKALAEAETKIKEAKP